MRTYVGSAGAAALLAFVLVPGLAQADDITANFDGDTSWFLGVQADPNNTANITQNARRNFSVIQQQGKNNIANTRQNGSINGSVILQYGGNSNSYIDQSGGKNVGKIVQKDPNADSVAKYMRTGESTYVTFFQSNGVRILSVTPFPLPSSTYGRAH